MSAMSGSWGIRKFQEERNQACFVRAKSTSPNTMVWMIDFFFFNECIYTRMNEWKTSGGSEGKEMRGEKLEGYYWNLVFWISLSNCDGNEIKQHNNRVCAQSCLTLCNPWTVARQAPLFMGFSRQEYWSGLPRPPPGDFPNPGIKPASLRSPAIGR